VTFGVIINREEIIMNIQATVQVWDILIRLFHWSLVVAFIVAYLTSKEENPWHIYSGYLVLGLIIFRISYRLGAYRQQICSIQRFYTFANDRYRLC